MEKPLDALQGARNKRVLVELWNGTKYIGVLVSFDLHSNIVLNNAELEDGTVKEWVFLRNVFGLVIL